MAKDRVIASMHIVPNFNVPCSKQSNPGLITSNFKLRNRCKEEAKGNRSYKVGVYLNV